MSSGGVLDTSLADLPPWATKCTHPHLGCYGFLTTQPNAIVEPIHPKAMPVTHTISLQPRPKRRGRPQDNRR